MAFPSVDDMAAARWALAVADPALARIEPLVPPVAWRVREGGFAGLAWMIVGQQVSTASARAIWGRVEAGMDGSVTAAAVLVRTDEALKAMGLSSPKVRYLRALAEAEMAGRIDFIALQTLEDDAARAALVALPGIGPWTAETYLMFCQGRMDLFPAADVALQEAMRWLDRLDVRPTADQARARAEIWRPWRSVAAHLLWAWYGGVKRGEIRPALPSDR